MGLRQDRGDHGVLRPLRHPAPVRARRHVHHLRRLPLLHAQLHQPQPQLPVERQLGRRAGRRSRHRQRRLRRGHPQGLRLAHVRRTPREGGPQLADVHRVGELHRQPDRVLRLLQGGRPQGAGQDRRAHVHGVVLRAGPQGGRQPATRPSGTGCSGSWSRASRRSPRPSAACSSAPCAACPPAPWPSASPPTSPPRSCPRSRTWCRPRWTPSTPASPCPPRAPASRTRCSTRWPRTPTYGARPSCSSTTTRTTASSTTSRRPCPRRASPTSGGRGSRPGSACACRCSSSRRGRWAVTSAPSCSTTPPSTASWRSGPVSTTPTSRRGAAGYAAT